MPKSRQRKKKKSGNGIYTQIITDTRQEIVTSKTEDGTIIRKVKNPTYGRKFKITHRKQGM